MMRIGVTPTYLRGHESADRSRWPLPIGLAAIAGAAACKWVAGVAFRSRRTDHTRVAVWSDEIRSNACLVQPLTAINPCSQLPLVGDEAHHGVERTPREKRQCPAHRPPSRTLGPDHCDRT